jgi:hypothetical protein
MAQRSSRQTPAPPSDKKHLVEVDAARLEAARSRPEVREFVDGAVHKARQLAREGRIDC